VVQSNTAHARRGRRAALGLAVALVAATAAILGGASPALGESNGGVGPDPTAPGSTAQLLANGDAVAPEQAPQKVADAIEYANRINDLPYKWGGGHSSWKLDKGYDCSGSVSYMLHGAGVLRKSPLDSGSLANWGSKGKGQWITVYANGGHTYAVVAGLRWDTSGGAGPRWHEDMRSSKGFRIRHFKGL
jgi:cell wall-associated NlpC family hydrolase